MAGIKTILTIIEPEIHITTIVSENKSNNSQNSRNWPNNRPEALDIDSSVHQFENFPALASDTNYPI